MDRELLRARYATFAALALVFSIFLITELPWSPIIGAVVGFLCAWLLTAVLEFWLRLSLRRAAAIQQVEEFEQKLQEANHQLKIALGVQQKLLDARSEKDILEVVLETGADLFKASGASFVPFDEWGKSLPALIHGKVPETALQTWFDQLASPETRHTCKNCHAMHGSAGCVLVPITLDASVSVRCFPLRSGGREAGVVNYYFDRKDELVTGDRMFLVEILHAAGKALDGLIARDQEIEALRYLQKATAPKSDLPELLNNLLENVQQALDVDFALIYIPDGGQSGTASTPLLLSKSRADRARPVPTPDLSFLGGIWNSVLSSGHSMSLENVTLNKREVWRVLLAVPLVWRSESPTGVLLLGSHAMHTFSPRHQVLLETLAGQAALLIQNSRLMVQVEYQAVVEERTRLAREIHDGLAQTLAFLKIQAAQMQNYLSRGDMDRLNATLQSSYRTLSDAYLDARQSIDNLRRTPSSSLHDWIGQVASDFQKSAGIPVDLTGFELGHEFSPNIQVQLIRIMQEALSNIRKHAKATSVAIVSRKIGKDIIIEIIDNGLGFMPEQVDSASRYGLRGMRERAEMIGSDFQIASQPGNGTTISLRLPAAIKEEA